MKMDIFALGGVFLSVSLCMIVKNEEESLARCLDSVKNIVDEMIIVDTGSEDSTVKIAASYGAKVFHYKWNDSFADARNFSLSKAECDWILVMDADDELVKEDVNKLQELINDRNAADVYYMKTLCFTGEVPDLSNTVLNMNVRLIRNGLGYHFEGNIHEHPVGGPLDHPMLTADICFYHYGYMQQPINAKNKRNRNKKLIEKEIQKHPNDPMMLFYLGNEYFAEKDFKTAIAIFKESLAICSPHSSLCSKLYFKLILCNQFLGNFDEAIKCADKVLACFPNFTDAELLRASLLVRQGKLSKAIQSLNKCIKMGDPPPMLGTILGAGTFQPHQTLSEIYFNMHLFDKSYYHCSKALKLGSLNRSTFLLMQTILCKKGYSFNTVLNKLMKYAISGGDAAFLIVSDIYYDQRQYDEAIKFLEKADKLNSDSKNAELISYYKGCCYFYKKEFIKAKEYFSTVQSNELVSKSHFLGILCSYPEKFGISDIEKESIQEEYYDVLLKFKDLLEGKECMPFSESAQGAQNYIVPIFSLLDILLKTERFHDFEKALGLLRLINDDNIPLLLAKTYYNNKQYKSAYSEFIRSISLTGKIDIQGLDMMKSLLCAQSPN